MYTTQELFSLLLLGSSSGGCPAAAKRDGFSARTSFKASFKTSLEMAPVAADESLDVSPGSVTFPVPVVDIVRLNNDGRARMFTDDTDTLKTCFHCSWCKRQATLSAHARTH